MTSNCSTQLSQMVLTLGWYILFLCICLSVVMISIVHLKTKFNISISPFGGTDWPGGTAESTGSSPCCSVHPSSSPSRSRECSIFAAMTSCCTCMARWIARKHIYRDRPEMNSTVISKHRLDEYMLSKRDRLSASIISCQLHIIRVLTARCMAHKHLCLNHLEINSTIAKYGMGRMLKARPTGISIILCGSHILMALWNSYWCDLFKLMFVPYLDKTDGVILKHVVIRKILKRIITDKSIVGCKNENDHSWSINRFRKKRPWSILHNWIGKVKLVEIRKIEMMETDKFFF